MSDQRKTLANRSHLPLPVGLQAGVDAYGSTKEDQTSTQFMAICKITGEQYHCIRDGYCVTWCRWVTKHSITERLSHMVMAHMDKEDFLTRYESVSQESAGFYKIYTN